MTHKLHCNFYVASCEKDGGIYECEYCDGEAKIKNVTHLDRPMYMITEGNVMHVILREGFSDKTSAVVSYEITGNGLTPSGEPVSTGGIVACHLCVLGNDVYCTNYLSGSVTRLGIKTVTHSGKGINPARQEMPHTHYINSFDKKHLLCTDLGTDEIYVYDKELCEISRAKVPSGHGPRHLEFKDGYVYCANELESTVSVFSFKDGVLSLKNTVSVLEKCKRGSSTAAAIRIKDDCVYVSNRGDDSISVLKIKGDTLELVCTVPCGGESPRDFNIFKNLMVCTNELTGNVTFFDVSGDVPVRLEGELKIKSALCVCQ